MTGLRTFLASIVTILIVGVSPIAAAVPASAQLIGGLNLELGRDLARGPDLEPHQGSERRPGHRGEGAFETAAAGCSGAAAQAAAQTGGQVLSVSSREQGGETVCVVTLLVPGKDGGRPRKTTVTLRP